MTEDIGGLKPAYYRVIGSPGSDLYGFVVIDGLVSGRGTGGVRCTESVTLEEVARLANEMSLKFAFLHLPSGGAKAGLVARPGLTDDERLKLFRDFGEAISDLIGEGKYVGGLDMGTGPADVQSIMAGAGMEVQPGSPSTDIDSNYFTALTVFVSIQALLEARGRPVRGTSFLVEGVGKVGGHLLRLLDDAGARIVGVSTLAGAVYSEEGLAVDEIIEARSAKGDEFVTDYAGCQHIPADELFLQSADVLIPGGGADSLNDGNIGDIKARWIVPVANICATERIEKAMFRLGIEFVPGFVSNSGGVFCWYLGRLSSIGRENIIRDGFKARIHRLVETADRTGRSIPDTARDIALKNLAAMRRIDNGELTANMKALGKKLSPRRITYTIGSRLLGRDWGRNSNFLVRSYYDARYFD